MHTCHEEDIVGTAPLLMASKNDCVIPARTGPVKMVAPTCLGRVRSKMNFVNASRPDLNSGLNSFNYKIQRDGIDKNTNKINKHN